MATAPEISTIVERKRSHFELCANHDVEFRNKTTLFEDVELIHYALTSTNLDEIDLSVNLFGKRLEAPLMITGMTGGTPEAGAFNRQVAALAERLGVGFGVGSQRAMLSQPELTSTFQVRDGAPDVLLFGNIGIAQLRDCNSRVIEHLTSSIGADALCVHFNTAMEIIQERGDHDFRGSLEALGKLIRELPRRIVIKETGCGLDRETGRRLEEIGADWVDVAGAGGTSWVGVETLRNRALRHLGEAFWDWGIPTAASLCELRGSRLNLIASGGIRNGIQAAKALALGARVVGVALPVLRAYVQGGVSAVEAWLRALIAELRAAIMLCGCARVSELDFNRVVIRGQLRDWMMQRGPSD
jgi:isopentenyl-diphosphate delta-isomerase